MIRVALFVIYISFFSVALHAQVQLKGHIVDNDGESLIGVIVNAIDQNNQPLAYTTSDRHGDFSISVPDASGVSLKFSYMGYQSITTEITNPSKPIYIKMQSTPFKLKEVTVKVVPIQESGDTLTYNVAAFRSAADRTIEDVIKRLPGINIEPSGQILYNGESINKFYIEGLDMLSGRYALATKNISPDDIAEVNIYENHQPKQVLKGIEFSDKAALNLTLKKKRMLKPIGYITAGGGCGDNVTWLGELYSMLISPGNQTLITAKGNNFGTSYNAETASYIGDLSLPTAIADNVFDSTPLGLANIPQSRYFDNKSASASVNSIFKLNKNLTITANADYTYDNESYSNTTQTDYLTSDGDAIGIIECGQSAMRHQKANIELNIENNNQALYIRNRLKLKGTFDDNSYRIDGNSYGNIGQQLDTDRYAAGNRFNAIIRRGNRIYEFSSEIALSNLPNNRIDVYPAEASSPSLFQSAKGLAFTTYETTSFGWIISPTVNIGVNASFDSDYDKIKTISSDGSINDNSGYQLCTTATPFFRLNSNRVILKIEVPLRIYNIDYNNYRNGSDYTLNRPYVNLRTSLNYSLRSNIKFSFTGGHSTSLGGLNDFVESPVYTSYRTQSILGAGELSVRRSWYTTASFFYRNSLKGLFLTAKGMFRRSQNNTIGNSIVTPDNVTTHTEYGKSHFNIGDVYLYAAKNIRPISTTISLTATGIFTSKEIKRQGVEHIVNNNVYDLSLNVASSLFDDRLSVNLEGKYSIATLSTGLADNNSTTDITASCNVSVFPIREFEIFAHPYFNSTEIGDNMYQHALYLDGGARYIHNRFELELKCNNLTNRHIYSYRRYSGYDTYTYIFNLRPREFILSAKLKF